MSETIDPSQDPRAQDLPAPLTAALDALERELCAVPLARLLKRRQLNPASARLALGGLKAYLAGDKDQAIQLFETLAEELRDLTVQLP